jgi:hypothetical protein
MGDAFVAVSDDPSAVYFNPAGLAHLSKREIMANHIAWIAGTNHEHITGVLPISGVGTIALSVTALTTGDMEQTLIDDPTSSAREDSGTGLMFTSTDLAIAATYSRQITDKLAFGVTARSVTEQIWNVSSSGLAADVGLLYHTGWHSLRIGSSVTNFGADLSFGGINLDFVDSTWRTNPTAMHKTTPAPLPVLFRFGVAYDLLSTTSNRVTAALDLVHPSDINETVNFGLEYGLKEQFFLRGGYIFNTDPSYADDIGWNQGISAGAGLAFRPFPHLDMKLDYGYRNQGFLGNTHRVTLALMF